MDLQQCPACGDEVDAGLENCPSCGVSLRRQLSGRAIGYLSFAAFLVICSGLAVGVYVWSALTNNEPQWFEVGNLADKTALDWQQATNENKLASCATLIRNTRDAGEFNEAITEMVDFQLYPMSAQLMLSMDSEFKKDPDPEVNQRIYKDVLIATRAAAIMAKKDWMKPDGRPNLR